MVKKKNTGKQSKKRDEKYDTLDPVIEELHKGIDLKDEETEILNKRFGKVIEYFIQEMKTVNPLFEEIFSRIIYTGSFYEGLKLTEATEYDVNLVLYPKLKMYPVKKKRPAGYVGIEVRGVVPTHYKDWIMHFKNQPNGHYLIDPKAVKSWLQGIVVKATDKVNSAKLLEDDFKITCRESGPAWTLTVECKKAPRKTIDIDLVPVFEFPFRSGFWPRRFPTTKKIYLSQFENHMWYAVPKSPVDKSSDRINIDKIPDRLNIENTSERLNIAWRWSLPTIEREILRDLNFLKYTIRLLKMVRDELKMTEIASYFIKTLFMLELREKEPAIWTHERRAFLFIYMLKRLEQALKNGCIPSYWHNSFNLLGKIEPSTLDNYAGKLSNFISRIDHNLEEPKWIKQYFISLLRMNH